MIAKAPWEKVKIAEASQWKVIITNGCQCAFVDVRRLPCGDGKPDFPFFPVFFFSFFSGFEKQKTEKKKNPVSHPRMVKVMITEAKA